ncbi:MAG: ABC transporter substrate-binding protein [Acidimicrobiia bacterium]
MDEENKAPESDATFRDERKVVTALFADVAGSTALGAQLDPEEFRLIIGDAVDRMIRAVELYGGTVKEIAGDGLLVLFGAPVVHEDDPERSIHAALAITTAIERYAREVEEGWGIKGFSVRVGICTGAAVLGTVGDGAAADYTAYGDSVNTAARLQGHAEPGSILVDRASQLLAEPLFSWGSAQELDLKGKEGPVTAYAVRGTVVSAEAAGPPLLHSKLIGRDSEYETLTEVAESLAAGRGSILFLTGEAGIGKSRLLDELRRLVESHPSEVGPALWLEGNAASYGEATPYWPFRDLIRRWLGVAQDEGDLRVRVALRREVERLFEDRAVEVYPYLASMLALGVEPEAAEWIVGLSPESLQYRTFEVIGQLIAQLADDRPVVVGVEDLHWADPTSVQLLETLMPASESLPILVAVTARMEPDHQSWDLRAAMVREFPHTTTELSLETLPAEANRRLLRALVGEVLPGDLERSVLETAEGNPFFLEELVRTLVDEGALTESPDGWAFDHAVDVELPATVERVILARIDRLDPRTHDVLRSASVLGREFTMPLLEAVTQASQEDLDQAAHQLQRLDFVRQTRRWPDPEYQFKHALIQEAAYRTLLKADRVLRHELVGRFLEETYSDNQDEVLGLLAYHWAAAEVEDKAIRYLTKAGDQARLEYALDEAIDQYVELLELLERRGDDQQAALILFKLALALHMSLRFAEANRAYQRAFEYWKDSGVSPTPPSVTLRVGGGRPMYGPDFRSHFLGDIQLNMSLHDRLVEAWPERTIIPSLAERWTISDDGLRYTFHLREGLTWSDGEPLTAHDVEFGIKQILDPVEPGMSVAIYFVLEDAQDYHLGRHQDPDRVGVRALDDRTVEFRLVAPAPYFMWVVNRPDGGPQPRHLFESDQAEKVGTEVVSGPFRLIERDDDHLVIERRDDYTRSRPGNVARVEWTFGSEELVPAFQTADLELLTSRFEHFAALYEAVPDRVRTWPPAWGMYLTFDHSHVVTGSADFRRALAHAIDREALRELAPPTWIIATGGLVPPPLQGHTPDISLRFEPDLARESLANSGVDIGPLVIPVLPGPSDEPVIRRVSEDWREVLDLDVTTRELTMDEYASGEADKYLVQTGGWYPGYPDPEYFLRLLLHSESATNFGGFADEHFDQLIEQARQERNDRKRLELYHEADRYAIADQVAVIPLWYAANETFIQPGVEGWWEFGKSWPNYGDLIVDNE